MQSATRHLSISAVRADALFASAMQRSDKPSAAQIRRAITAAVRAFGGPDCAARVAQAYGDHPEIAVTRMRWARTAAAAAFDSSRPEAAPAQTPAHYIASGVSRAA
jgi:hypothetical protein